MTALIENFEQMLASGQDNAFLRFSLGNAYLNNQEYTKAVTHLEQAIAYDPNYSAAWKCYGKALAANERLIEAVHAYTRGITVAEQKGDKQASKEMRVFLKRLQKKLEEASY